MSKCRWVVDQSSGDHILMKNGKECARIKEGENIRVDEGRPGSSTISLEQLRTDMEKECGCTEMVPD